MTMKKWVKRSENTGKRILFAMGFILIATGCSSIGQSETAAISDIGGQTEAGDKNIEQADVSRDSVEQPEQEKEDFTDIEQAGKTEAVYLGVEHYGAEEINKENKDTFRYRFEIDGKEEVLAVDNGTKDGEGKFDYPIQNVLKEGYFYEIKVENGVVTEAVELPSRDDNAYNPPVTGTPGEHTLKNFLATALEPVGTTLYIYGGGWNWQDEGSSIQTTTIGVAPEWIRFFNEQILQSIW